MNRVMWAPMGASGQVVHAIAVIHSGGDGAVSLCGHEAPLRSADDTLPACTNCQETLKALVDTMPANVVV